MRYRITLSYDGSGFSGWQIQPNGPSIQESLQKALSTLLKEEISVTGAGRTDAGVNAINYVAHFDAARAFDTAAIGYKINAMMPPGIIVHGISETSPDFNSRFDAESREYMYFLNRKKDPFAERFS